MPNPTVAITSRINGRTVTREDVLDWEATRIRRAARKIGVPNPTGDLTRQRSAFRDAKLALTATQIRDRLHRDVTLADATARVTARLSRGRRAASVCGLNVRGGSARAFVDWFSDVDRADYARSMVAANPDHFLIDTAPGGRQEVIETTGGSPFATRFLIDYDDLASLATPRDPAFTLELAGVALTDGGAAIGGVRHQFRDTDDGFQARLLVEFPRLTSPTMISAHRWHLACEFSNWIEAAFAA